MFKILGTGMYLPKNLVTNEQLYARFGRENLEKAFERIGHGARYYCDPKESSADLAVMAAKQAIENAKISPSELDLLIVATDTPAHISPATASQVQFRLEAKNAGTFDVNCACSGFVTALDIANKYLDGKQYRKAIVIGTYAMSKFLDQDDGMSAPLLGDGAGAFVIEYRENATNKDRMASKLIADGQYWDYMGIYAGGSMEPVTPEVLASRRHCVKFPKRFPASVNSDNWPKLVKETLDMVNLTVDDVNMYIFTQIRKVTIVEVMDLFKQPMSKTHTIMEKWGYTGSGCIPMAFHDAIQQGKVKRGDRVVLCASGGGFAMATMTFTY